MKHLCLGCVWIHPKTITSSFSQYSNNSTSPSSVISHVSLVAVCAGITNLVINNASDFNIPHRMPHVSRLSVVLGEAECRKCVRREVGRKSGRRGSPDSR